MGAFVSFSGLLRRIAVKIFKISNDMTITMAAESGQLQLNAMEPVIAYNLLESIRILTNALKKLTDKCVEGIKADENRCKQLLLDSLILSTALVPKLGYEKSSEVAKAALREGKTISEFVNEKQLMTVKEFEEAATMEAMLC